MAKHSFCHIEWTVTNLERARKFYGGLFDWTFEAWGENYLMFNTPAKDLGGGFELKSAVQAGASPVVYIDVEDIEPYLEKAVALGGSVMTPKGDIPNIGWYAIIKDPDGNAVGLFQGLPK